LFVDVLSTLGGIKQGGGQTEKDIIIQSAPNPLRRVFLCLESIYVYMDIKKIIREETDEMDWIRSEGHDAPSESDVLNTPMQSTVGDYLRKYSEGEGMFFTFFTDGPQIFEILTGGNLEYLVHENIEELGKYISSQDIGWTSIDDYLNEFPAVRKLEEFDPKLYGILKSKFPFITEAYAGTI